MKLYLAAGALENDEPAPALPILVLDVRNALLLNPIKSWPAVATATFPMAS